MIRRPRIYTRANQLIIDGTIFAAAFASAYLIRFEGMPRWDTTTQFLLWLPYLVAARLYVNWKLGIYHFIWRYVSLPDVLAFAGDCVPHRPPVSLSRPPRLLALGARAARHHRARVPPLADRNPGRPRASPQTLRARAAAGARSGCEPQARPPLRSRNGWDPAGAGTEEPRRHRSRGLS